jgi:hypothetical protein
MSGAARVGDILGPGGLLTAPASSNVIVNGRPVALLGCIYTPHPCCGVANCPPTHCFGPTVDSDCGVMVNNQIPLRKGSIGLCGHTVMTASSNVIFGKGSILGLVAGAAANG